jgi:phenylalanine-4-hydroxylase
VDWVINPDLVQLQAIVRNQPGILARILHYLKDMNVNIHNIESNFRNGDWENVYIDIFIENLKDKHPVSEFAYQLAHLGCKVTEMAAPRIPDFPLKLTDLNNLSLNLQDLDQNLSKDHPGFSDPEYRKRRNDIGQASKGYKIFDPIPRVHYSDKEIDVWKFLYKNLRPLVNEHANMEYVENIQILEKEGIFREDRIPQLDDINRFLNKKTNWRIKPVNGILSQREYLNCLAFRTFPSTQYIRHHSKPLFTPEPDLVHEFIGHVPNFCDPVFCDISQELGILSLGASDSVIKLIGAVYWFTIEFGACQENGKMKFYGAGIGGGMGEIENFLKCKDFRRLQIDSEFPPTSFVIQDVQPFYMYIEAFDEYLQELRRLSTKLAKPFKYAMNRDSTELFIDRKIQTYPEEEKKDMFNM